MTRKEIILLITLAAINFTNIMDFMIMMPLQEFLEQSIHINPRQFGILVSSYAFSAFLASMTASFIADRFDRKKVLLVAFSGLIVGTISCGFANSYAMLLLARIVAGIFGGLIGAQALAIIGDTFPYEKRGRAMGLLMSGFALAAIAGVPIALFLATKTDWHMPFLAIGCLGILLLFVVIAVVPSMTGHMKNKSERNVFAVYQSIWKNRNQQNALLMMVTLIFAHFSTIPFIAPFLTKNTGFLQEQLPIMYFFGGLSSMIASPLVGKLSDKFGKHKIFTVWVLMAIIPVYLLTNLTQVPLYHVLIITTLFFIFGGGRMVPAQALMTSVIPSDLRGGFMNLAASLQQLGLGLSALMGGLIITKNSITGEMENYNIIGYISIAVSMICLFITWQVRAIQTTQTDKI